MTAPYPNAMRRERGYATTVIERTPSGRLLFLTSKQSDERWRSDMQQSQRRAAMKRARSFGINRVDKQSAAANQARSRYTPLQFMPS
jgi:hypothetical protein